VDDRYGQAYKKLARPGLKPEPAALD